MEYILDEYIIANILSFLDQKSLRIYDVAMTSKKLRKLYLSALEKTKFNIQISIWTILRNIKKVSYMCHYIYSEFYEYDIKKLIIYGCHLNNQNIFSLKNDHIETLHIDVFSKVTLISLKAKKLKTIFIVNLYDINEEVIKNLEYTCPRLEKITIICSYGSVKQKLNSVSKNIDIHSLF